MPHVVAEYHDGLGSLPVPLPTHATMYFDGRYKSIVYHGHDLGEQFGLRENPGEFVNLWDDRGARDLRTDLLRRHFDAVMATSSAGVDGPGSTE